MDLYLSEDGQSGIAVKPNGDIVSVFAGDNAPRGSGYTLMLLAIQNGGRQLDCFDTHLPDYYSLIGFKPVAKMKWNDEYIPEGWNKENFKDYNNGEPDVVFMAYDPNNDIEKQHESLEDTMEEIEKKRGYRYKRKTREEKIPYIIDYDDGEKFQHQYKWRSPAEREAIYNNMLKRYKNAKTTEELKKVVFDNDKPLEVFYKQMFDLSSLSKEQVKSIEEEYSNRYLELIKEENPEEYKKKKKSWAESKYNITGDASYLDTLNDAIEYYIDAKKKEFKESDVNRDEDGKFAKKGSSSNKSNDKKETEDNGGIENSKKYINKCVKSLPKHLQPIGKRLYSGELGGGELVYKSKYTPIGGNFLDQDKLDNLSDTEYSIFAFTEDGRQNSGWEERDNSDIIELIQKSPLKREALFRGEPENNIGELKVGKIINFGNKIRSFTNTEDGKSIAKGFAFKYNTKEEGAARPIVYQINKPVHALCINPLSYYQSQEDEYLCYGEFKITKVLKKKNFDFIIIEPLE